MTFSKLITDKIKNKKVVTNNIPVPSKLITNLVNVIEEEMVSSVNQKFKELEIF